MKKMLTLLIVILAITFTAPMTMAFEALSGIGIGFLSQKGQAPEVGYYVGFEIPIVTKDESGFLFKTETGYFYANQGEQEIQALRVLTIVEKTIMSTWTLDADGNRITTFKWFIGGGSGTWTFTSVMSEENPDSKDEMFGALNVRTGIYWSGINFMAQVDVVQLPGADIFATMAGFSFSF